MTPKRLLKEYNKGYRENSYTSIQYIMTPKTEKERELQKTYYIENIKERLKRVREIEKDKNLSEYDYIDEQHETTSKEKAKFKECIYTGMFYNSEKNKTTTRILEMTEYIDEINKTAYNLLKTSTSKAINYLIDKQFLYHKNIFSNYLDDLFFRDEYNAFIFDLLQNTINEIVKIEPEPIEQTLKSIQRKPLTWNADKDTIGTLFGLLYKAGIITGKKADLNRSLTAIFNNLTYTTIKKNLELSSSVKEGKTYHDTETVYLVKNWIEYLKNQL